MFAFKKLNRIISAFLALSIFISLLPTSALGISNILDQDFSGGNGTKDNPYVISTANEFQKISSQPDAHYILAANLTLSDNNRISSFSGTLNGDGHSLNVTYNNSCGLFDKIEKSGVVKNLTVNVNINSKCGNFYDTGVSSNTSSAYWGFGSICYVNYGTIDNCIASGILYDESEDTTSLNSVPVAVGGICAISPGGTITLCRNNIDISLNGIPECNGIRLNSARAFVGGISGRDGIIKNCLNTGDIKVYVMDSSVNPAWICGVGGIEGSDGSGVSNCASASDILSLTYHSFGGTQVMRIGLIYGYEFTSTQLGIFGSPSRYADECMVSENCSAFLDYYGITTSTLSCRNVTYTNYTPMTKNSIEEWWNGLHGISEDPDDPITDTTTNICYFKEWDSKNQIAYFEGELLHLGAEVTDETETSFLADVEDMVGNYVLVATKKRTDDLVGPDILLSMQPVTAESRLGKIEEITSDSVKISTGEKFPFGWNFTIQSDEFPEYQNEFALCYLYEDLVFEIKIVNFDVGTVIGYDKAAGTITIGDTVYQISTLADETIEALLESSPEGESVYYYADADNMIYRALLCAAEAPEEEEFDADIYRANQLLNPDQYVHAYYIIDDIARQTPSGAYAEAMSSNKEFKEAILLWDSSTTVVDVLQKGPTEAAKFLMEKKNIYTALILASLQEVSEKDVGEKVAETGKKVNSALKKAAGDIKNTLQLDLFVTEQYQSMTNSQKEKVKEILEKELKNISGLKNGIQIAESVGKLLETTSSFADLYNMLLDNIYLVTMAESQKQLITEMYENCSEDTPVNLKAALLQCKTIAESSYEEVVTGTLTYSLATSNFKAVADSYWKLLIETAEQVDPMLAAMSAGYKAGKAASNLLFNTDGVVEQYYKVVAITELEDLAFTTLNNLQEQYRSSRSAEDARTYLAMCDLLYGIFSVDCAQAIALVDEMDSAALTEWAKLLAAILGNENSQAGSYEEAKKTLESLQSLYERSHKHILTVWVEYLPEDYPNTNLYEYYTDLINEDPLSIQKRLSVACPVNVQILNEKGQPVAWVEDGRISSSGNVAVQLENDKKTFYFYDNADYTVAIQGYDTGSMNVTATEYNEQQQEIRNVYYNNIAVTPQSNYQMNVCGEQLQLSSFQLLGEQSAQVEQTLDTINAGDATMHTVQIENGALQVNGMFSTQAQVYPGQQVNIYASGLSDQEFLRWEISGNVNLEDDMAVTTYFIMPDEDVSLKAILTPTNLDPTVPDYDIPSGLTAIYGQILADITLPENWSWKTPEEKVGDVGNREFEAIYTPNPAEEQKTVTELLTVSVSPKDIVGAAVELGESLTYNGQNQVQSIKAVTKDGETVTYQVTGNTGRNAGNYTMTVTGNGNFTGTVEVAWCIAAANYNFEISDQKVAFDSKLSDVQCESTAIGVGQEHVVGTLSWYLDDTYEQQADENYIFTGEDFITLYWKFVPAEGQNNYKKDPKQGKTIFELIEKGGEQTTPGKDDSDASNSTTGNSQEIEDNKTPVSNVPATNDSFQLELWIAVLLVSGMGIIFLSTAHSQKRNKRKE